MKFTELKDKSIAELESMLKEKKLQLFELRLKQKTMQLTKTSDISLTRKDIAKINTAIAQQKDKK